MPTVADLFCGAGGFSLGFSQAGFTPVFALDYDQWSCATYTENFGDHVFLASIEDVRAKNQGDSILWQMPGRKITTPSIDVLVGGPPCQGFSLLNRRASTEDPRNSLWKQYYRLLKNVSPQIFVIENVPQLLHSHEFAKLLRRARTRGYDISFGVLRAELYGVPQRRNRAFVIGVLGDIASLPEPIFTKHEVRDVRWAFRGLSLEPDGMNLHVGRNPTALSVQRYETIPEGGNRFDLPHHLLSPCWRKKHTGSTDVFGRMLYNRPSPTIRTEFVKPEKGRYLHPLANRPITLREGARLQTFPDNFAFAGSRTQIAKQIGNAVPPGLAQAIASHILSCYFPDIEAAA